MCQAGEPAGSVGCGEGIAFVTTRFGVGSRQRLLRCLAVSALLHLLLTLSVGSGPGLARTVGATPQPAAHGVLHGILLKPRVSAKGDGASGETPARKVAETAPPAGFESPRPLIEPETQIAAQGIVPVPLTEPYYFRPSELQVRPRVVSDVQPRFPLSAEGAVAGKIVLRLLIGETGHVDSVLVEFSELPPAFQDSAIEAFAKAVFAPGEIGGVAVKSQMRIEVAYEQAE